MEAGPYLQTVSGRRVNPFDPDPEQLDIEDIARALANLCRFGGHSRVFYSVAQHFVIVSELVEQRGGDAEDIFAALMHDAAEAYLGDMPHPIKHRSPLGTAFKAAEGRLEAVIHERFGIKPDVPEIKRADRALLATERRVFSGESWRWPELDDVEPLDLELERVVTRGGGAVSGERFASWRPGVSPEEARETAQVLLTGRRDAELLEFSESVVELFPNDPELRMIYATALMKHRRRCRRRSRRPSGSSPTIHGACSAPRRSRSSSATSTPRASISSVRTGSGRTSRRSCELIHLGGRLAAVAGDDELAEELLRSAFELEPQDLVFGRDLARFLAERGRIDEALIVIDRAQEFAIDTEELARLRSELR